MTTSHFITTTCTECHGCGWTCSNCGKPEDGCKCSAEDHDPMDCQTCEGEGTVEIETEKEV